MNSRELRAKTIFCDIDGTIVKHELPSINQNPNTKLCLLEGTIEKFLEWDKLGYKIILTTGRKESLRKVTIDQLETAGIIYDLLIMGIGGGKRYLINDIKPESNEDSAFSINLKRNQGIKKIEI